MNLCTEFKVICYHNSSLSNSACCLIYAVLKNLKEEFRFSLAKIVLNLFSTRVKMSSYVNPFIELAAVLDATPQIKSCMITTNKNTHSVYLIPYTLKKLTRPL